MNTEGVKSAISLMMLVAPVVLFVLSFLVFTFKFKLHGKYMEEITAQINEYKLQSESNTR
jgi:Na+/melibiose symporter-like transporter